MGRPKVNKIVLICPVCQEKFRRYVYDVKIRKAKYCSCRCRGESQRKKIFEGQLIRLYIRENLSMKKIAKKFGCSDMTIKKLLLEANIKVRTMGEAVGLAQTGIKHNEKWNKAISLGHQNMSTELRRKKNRAILKCCRNYGNRSKGGIRKDLGIYVRSRWEGNVCRVLNLLKENKNIKSWDYEYKTFEFPLKKGTRFYTPDFRIVNKNGLVEWWEVKGYMNPRSKTQLRRFQKYYPNEYANLFLITGETYKEIERCWSSIVPHWEYSGNKKKAIDNKKRLYNHACPHCGLVGKFIGKSSLPNPNASIYWCENCNCYYDDWDGKK